MRAIWYLITADKCECFKRFTLFSVTMESIFRIVYEVVFNDTNVTFEVD